MRGNGRVDAVEERFSPGKNRAEAELKTLAPLFNKSGRAAGYLLASGSFRLVKGRREGRSEPV